MMRWYENCKGTCNIQKQMIVFCSQLKVQNLKDTNANKLITLKKQIIHHFKI